MTDLNLVLFRFQSGQDATLGALFAVTDLPEKSEPDFRCFTLEDEYREVKLKDETRIPAGKYEIRTRVEGGMHTNYAKRFPFHAGMLWLQNVPNFEWIYLHCGNTDDHSSGCILVGMGCNAVGSATLQNSEMAYTQLYKEVIKVLTQGKRAYIDVRDFA